MPYRPYSRPHGRPASGMFQLTEDCLEIIHLLNPQNPNAIRYNPRRHTWTGWLIKQAGGAAGRVIAEWKQGRRRGGRPIYRMDPNWTLFRNNKVLVLETTPAFARIAALTFYGLLTLDVKTTNGQDTPSLVHEIFNWRRKNVISAHIFFPVLDPFQFPLNSIRGDGVYVRRKDLVAG